MDIPGGAQVYYRWDVRGRAFVTVIQADISRNFHLDLEMGAAENQPLPWFAPIVPREICCLREGGTISPEVCYAATHIHRFVLEVT